MGMVGNGAYVEDEAHLNQYVNAAVMATKGDAGDWKDYRNRYIDNPQDHLAYLDQIGARLLFSLHEF